MRFWKFAACFLIAAIAFPCHVFAASFSDDMTVPQNTAEAQYSNLKPYAGATYGLSDQTLLTFSDNSSPQGYALYRVNAAETVTVGIYTSYGTCVAQKEAGPMLSQGTKQALWSKSKNMIYSDFGGSLWHIELSVETRYEPVFSNTSSIPADAIGFGLNIYAVPGTDKPLSATVTKSGPEALCYEEYTATIPAGTQYIKVEINDVTAYPLKGGGTMPNRIYTTLASVKISGEALVMGEPAKVERQQSAQTQTAAAHGDDEDVKMAESYSAAAAIDNLPDEPKLEDEAGASSEKSSASKFEGTITSSSKQEKSQTPKAGVQSEASVSASARSESEPSKEEAPRETVYEIRREGSGDGMSTGVTVYIVIVVGALTLVLIFGKRR